MLQPVFILVFLLTSLGGCAETWADYQFSPCHTSLTTSLVGDQTASVQPSLNTALTTWSSFNATQTTSQDGESTSSNNCTTNTIPLTTSAYIIFVSSIVDNLTTIYTETTSAVSTQFVSFDISCISTTTVYESAPANMTYHVPIPVTANSANPTLPMQYNSITTENPLAASTPIDSTTAISGTTSSTFTRTLTSALPAPNAANTARSPASLALLCAIVAAQSF